MPYAKLFGKSEQSQKSKFKWPAQAVCQFKQIQKNHIFWKLSIQNFSLRHFFWNIFGRRVGGVSPCHSSNDSLWISISLNSAYIQTGGVSKLLLIFRPEVSLNSADVFGGNALMYAAKLENPECLEILLGKYYFNIF